MEKVFIMQSSKSSNIGDNDMAKIESNAVPINTSRGTKACLNKLSDWIKKEDENNFQYYYGY